MINANFGNIRQQKAVPRGKKSLRMNLKNPLNIVYDGVYSLPISSTLSFALMD